MSKTIYGKSNAFCWAELFTSNKNTAKEFYKKLFSWDYSEVPIPNDNSTYTFASLKEGGVAGVYEINKNMQDQGTMPHWASYVAVDSIDEALAKVSKLNGKVIMPAMDVMEQGRMAIIMDPTGAYLSLWQSNKPGPQISRNLHGMVGCNELLTTDTTKAKEFYCALFGWSTEEEKVNENSYISFTKDGKYVAGMMKMQSEWGEIPPHWGIYFTVNDINESIKIATANGGEQLYPLHDLENIGKMVGFKDPSGAAFSIFEWASK